MNKILDFGYSFIVFGQEFSFVSATAWAEAQMLSRDCDTVQEFKAILNAEEVFYTSSTCQYVRP